MIIGIDLGNKVTKTSKLIKYYSTIKNGHSALNKNDIKVVYEGNDYTVGSRVGTSVLGNGRFNSDMYDACLLTAIAKSCSEKVIEADIVVGLPPEQFEGSTKTNLLNKLRNMGQQKIIVDGIERHIRIRKAEVFSEASLPFKNPARYRNKKIIILDIGGGTFDISQFNGLEREKYDTTKFGMNNLYTKMKSAINSEYSTDFTPDEMEDFIGQDTILINGERKDISFVNNIIKEHTINMFNALEDFNHANYELLLIGGGAEPLYKWFKDRYPNIQIADNAQFENALTYEAVGEMLFNV